VTAMSGTRHDGRADDELRPVTIETGVQEYAEGSALITAGRTRVLCAASVEHEVPRWMRGRGSGWVTAEYAMLPRATTSRNRRESGGNLKGRTQEIQRLIGRALRSAIDLEQLGERAIVLDCDVLQADGGTRTASITGAWVALSLALDTIVASGQLAARPALGKLSAISVGVVGDRPVLDLDYAEDVGADVDMNLVVNGDGEFVEVQGTAEGTAFDRGRLDAMLDLGLKGCAELWDIQAAAVGRSV
jgi:ribonuclease PH